MIQRRILKVKLEKDLSSEEKDGKVISAGTVLIRGAKCPRCKHFYAMARSVVACNICGYRRPKEEKK